MCYWVWNVFQMTFYLYQKSTSIQTYQSTYKWGSDTSMGSCYYFSIGD